MTREPVRIGIIGDFDPTFPPHLATDRGLEHAAGAVDANLQVQWLPTVSLEENTSEVLQGFDGLWCAPGSPYKSPSGVLNAIQIAREHGIPFIGTCSGFQYVVIEYARNVLGFADAQHAESDPGASDLFVSELACSLAGRKMAVRLAPGSRAHEFYDHAEVEEQYYCSFGLNPARQALIHDGGLRVVGVDSDGEARILEVPDHPFFVATLFVPQLTSSVEAPHPLIVALVEAAVRFNGSVTVASPRTVV